jgi:lipoprotein-anchoring transpeptidase ErfK/SrfK
MPAICRSALPAAALLLFGLAEAAAEPALLGATTAVTAPTLPQEASDALPAGVLTPLVLPTSAPVVAPPDPSAAQQKPQPPPPPRVQVRIDLSTQRMTVAIDGRAAHSFAISSGRAGYITPTGSFRPQWTARMWHSRKYDNAPMPHAVFFNGGIAVHATTATGMLGRPASHGCIRLAPANAQTFYNVVHRYGMGETRIVVAGSTPGTNVARRNGGPSRQAAQVPPPSNKAQKVRTAATPAVVTKPVQVAYAKPPYLAGAVRAGAPQRVARTQF